MVTNRSRTRVRRRRALVALYGAIVAAVIIAIAVLRPFDVSQGPRITPLARECPKVQSVQVGRVSVPAGPIAGYCQPQLVNAAQVMRAAQSLGIGTRGKQIGVMTAIGESGLRNLGFGDRVGPDSRGLFQQRANWGPLADRMNPYVAATHFYQRMLGVQRWDTRPETEVAHRVQGNADPNYYTKFLVRAQIIVAALNARANLGPWE